MPGYSRMQRASAQQKAADGSVADHQTEVLYGPATDALSESLNQGPQARSLLQMQRTLDKGAGVQSQLALQRMLSWTGPTHTAEAPAHKRPDLSPRLPNATGLPEGLKAGIEHLSGFTLDDVRVHYDSPKPAYVQARAYTQGTDIHLGPGQQRHLPHEAWHVVQQKQGRVKPTLQMKGVAVNEDTGLEWEADLMGARARALPINAADPMKMNVSAAPELHQATLSPGPGPGTNPSSNTVPIQFYRPLESDNGRLFLLSNDTIGRYTFEADRGDKGYLFTASGRPIRCTEDEIVGYRPTVALTHPPGQVRPVSDRLAGRDQVFLSEANLTHVHAQMRRDPKIAESAVATTYESEAEVKALYPDYQEQLGHIERQGIPVMHNVDLSNVSGSIEQLSNLASNPNLHFQMPRVPRVKGYSTSQLIGNTLDVAEGLKASTSITVPDPGNYGQGRKGQSTHNQIYGMNKHTTRSSEGEQGRVIFTGETGDPDQNIEDFGYVHKQSTKDQSAEAAKKRRRFNFEYKPKSEHEDYKSGDTRSNRKDDEDPGGGEGILG